MIVRGIAGHTSTSLSNQARNDREKRAYARGRMQYAPTLTAAGYVIVRRGVACHTLLFFAIKKGRCTQRPYNQPNERAENFPPLR
ncbi:MAG: hypothetical protein LBN27_02325 [Prevotellaceae bacterium]|nr:hypothetical protein [Prevotellaceae bacterium]